MKLTAWLVLFVAIPVSMEASGFLPGVLATRSTSQHAHLESAVPQLNSASLAQPADIRAQSAFASIEYTAENLLRTRKAGKLTADLQTWGASESLFVPLRINGRPTTFALSNISSNASLYYSDDDNSTSLAWKSSSSAYAICHEARFGRVGLASFWSSASMPGQSTYLSQALNIFTGSTPVDFQLDQKQTVLQFARSVAGTDVSVRYGGGPTHLRMTFGAGGTVLMIPAEADVEERGLDLTRRLNRHLTGLLGFSRSDGYGSNPICRNGSPIGRLHYDPHYRQTSAALTYQRRPDAVWQVGLDLTQWDLGLHGLSINGDKLGLNLKPFSERIDFSGSGLLSTDTAHIGMDRRMSGVWSWGWTYKLSRVRSSLTGDYVGRAFFGMISTSGIYDNSILNTTVHGIELSTRYAHKRSSFELRVEQIIPQASHRSHSQSGGSSNAPHGAGSHTASTGGTSVSFDYGYQF